MHTTQNFVSVNLKDKSESKDLPTPDSVGRPVHPSMRFKRNSQGTKSTDASIKLAEAGRPLHPSLRLYQNKIVKSPSDDCSLTVKSVKYQSEIVVAPSGSKEATTPTRGKPANYSLPGGKPANYSIPGGKPANYTSSLPGKKKNTTSGKPLSYLKSLSESSKPHTGVQLLSAKKKTARSRARKTVGEQNSSKGPRPGKEKKQIKIRNNSEQISTSSKENGTRLNAASAHLAKLLPEYRKQVVDSTAVKPTPVINHVPERVVSMSGKPFAQFKGITFDGANDKDSSDSESGSSSASESK